MKFVKSLLAVSILSVSAGAMAKPYVDPIPDGEMPAPIKQLPSDEMKRQAINSHLVGQERQVMIGDTYATVSNMFIDEKGKAHITVTTDEGTKTIKYEMDGANSDKIRAKAGEVVTTHIKEKIGSPIDDVIIDPIVPPVTVDPIKEQPHVDAIKAYVADHGEAARQATTDLDSRIAANDSRIGKNADAIDFNRQAINSLQEEVNRLDDKMDGVMASTHAVTNARPFLTGSGQTAVGVGTGFAGDSQAVAIGVAHSFNTNWSASMSVNATTGSDSDFSAGAGVQYVF